MELTQQPAQQGAEHAESFREAMFGIARAHVALIRATGNHLVAQNDEREPAAELTEADVDAEVERIERERAEADSAYDKFKNSPAYDEARIERARRADPLGRYFEDRPL